MATLICSLDNKRSDYPTLDLKSQNNDAWNPIVNTSRDINIIFTSEENVDKCGYLIEVKGVLNRMDIDFRNILEISGKRAPIHKIEKVSQLKSNKIMCNLFFSIDPTNMILGPHNTLSCNVKFPNGFSPLCYVSEKCDFGYIYTIVEKIQVIAVDVTPISYTILWGNSQPSMITIKSSTETEVLTNIVGKLEVINATPGEKYEITIVGENTFILELVMPELSVNGMEMFYYTKKSANGSFDMSQLKPQYLEFMRKNNILESGNYVHIHGEFNNIDSVLGATVLNSGERFTVKDECGLYIIPDFESDSDQYVCIEEGGKNHTIHFDRSETFVKYNNVIYPHSSTFKIGENRNISFVRGSIILVVTFNNSPFEFPGGSDTAAQILTSGDLIVKDVIARSTNQVVEKVSGDVTYNVSSYYVYDPSVNETQECSRVSHGLSDDKTIGTVKFSSLFDGQMVDTIVSTVTSTVITSRDTSDTLNATFDKNGLSFDNDTGAIYFGADKDFRIQFEDVNGLDPALLKIERLDGTDYVTSFLVTALPP